MTRPPSTLDFLTIANIATRLETYEYRARRDTEGSKWAGVAVLLRPSDNGPEMLLIQRSEQAGDPWSGHMALPGGRPIAEDLSIRQTAERETLEEVGIDLVQAGQYITRLDDVTAVGRGKRINLTISPHLYSIPENTTTIAEPKEVQNIVWIPIRELVGQTHRSEMTYETHEMSLQLPCWRWQGRVVWGLTYNIVETMLRMMI